MEESGFGPDSAGDMGENHKNRRRKLSREDVLSTKSMEQMLWSAACSIRGEKDAPKFKDYILRPRQGEEAYDFASGSAGLLIKCELALQEREIKIQRPLKLYGQELTGSSYAIARMNMGFSMTWKAKSFGAIP